jgi:hypothetical protein
MLRLLDSLSLPGDAVKANEDAFAHGAAAALVMDGATMLGEPLMPGPSDAAWIATFGARRLLAHLQDMAPKKALRAAMADAEKSFNALRLRDMEAQWQIPCASVMLVADAQASLPLSAKRDKGEGGGGVQPSPNAAGIAPSSSLRASRARARVASEGRRGVEFVWLGDCGAIIAQGDAVTLIGDTMAKRAEENARARKAAREKNVSSAAPGVRAQFMDHLRTVRARVNSGDTWLFSPDKRAAAHARRRIVKARAGALLLLASDGFLALASDYDAYDAAGLIAAAKAKGLAALGAELRAIENADAGGDRFARFKKSDDATALLLEIA